MSRHRLPPDPGAHPRVLVGGAVEVFGEPAVVAFCCSLIAQRQPPEPAPDLAWLGGRADWAAYWHRVWSARGLLYAWQDFAADDVLAGLRDPHWRVREMCLKTAIRRELVERIAHVAGLLDDENHRVRSAASRAAALERRA